MKEIKEKKERGVGSCKHYVFIWSQIILSLGHVSNHCSKFGFIIKSENAFSTYDYKKGKK